MANQDIKAILFDLGGVLIRLGGISQMMAWTNLSREEFWRRWLASQSVRKYEAGAISELEFGTVLVKEFDLPVTASEFLSFFSSWPQGAYDGAKQLLDQLRTNYHLGCLSNTNPLHWSYLKENTDLFVSFEFLFPSHLTGNLKPDQTAFLHAAEKMNLLAHEIIFLDDNQINVEAARTTGMESYLVSGVDGARSALKNGAIL